jgi:SulP family sulfate permease
LALAFLASLENTFMGKMLASRNGERIDVNQEMFALGAANVATAFFSGMPASGSLSRSSLNWSSGAVTPMAAIFSGLICTIAALTICWLVQFVPQASLAVIVIITAFGLIDRRTIRIALKSTKSDAAVLITTFIASLLAPLNFAIFLGVGISIMLFLRKVSTPQLIEYCFNETGQLAELEDGNKRSNPQISIIHIEGSLFFGAADLFRDQVQRLCTDPSLQVVILRMKNAHHLDATSVMAMTELIKYLHETGRHLIISGANYDVFRVCRNSGLMEMVGKENFFTTSVGNPNLSTRNALRRAAQLIGKCPTRVCIFHNEQNSGVKLNPS